MSGSDFKQIQKKAKLTVAAVARERPPQKEEDTLILKERENSCRQRKERRHSWRRNHLSIFPQVKNTIQSFKKIFFSAKTIIYVHIVKNQIRSVSQLCLTLCDPMNRSTPGLPVHHHLPEFTETHVHQVSDDIQPSHPLSSPSPLAPNPSQHQR